MRTNDLKCKISSIINWLLTYSEQVSSCVIFLTVILWFGFWAHIGVDPHHDGILLKPASDVLSGRMLFRETFTQYGALTTLLQALACAIFGVKIMTIRWLTVLFYAGSTVLVWQISGSILRKFYRIIPILCIFVYAPFYFWTFHSWSSVYALFFLLLTCRLFQLGFEKKRPDWFWCLTGAVSILGFWCRQPLGLVVPAAMILIIASHWRFYESWGTTFRRFGVFLGGITGVCALFWLWLTLNHAFADFWTQSFEFAFGFVSGRTQLLTNTKIETLAGGREGTLLGKLIWLFFFKESFWGILSALVTGWALYLTFRGFVKKNLTVDYWLLLPVVLLSGISLHQYYPVPCIRHLYWGGFPAFLIFARTIQSWSSRKHFPWNWGGIAGTFLIVGVAVCWATNNFCENNRRFSVIPSIRDVTKLEPYTRAGFLQGIWMPEWEKKAWNDLQNAVQQIPEPQRSFPVLNSTPNALYTLLFPNQRNWSPVYMNWPKSIDPNYNQKEILLCLNGCCFVSMEAGLTEQPDHTFTKIPPEQIYETLQKNVEQYLFQLAKAIFPDKETVEVPEYRVYGSGRFCFVNKMEYVIVIMAPTGKMLQKNRNEIDDE